MMKPTGTDAVSLAGRSPTGQGVTQSPHRSDRALR